MLAHNADVEFLAESHNRPLHIAAKKGHAKCVQLLLMAGANIWAKSEGGASALEVAKKNERSEYASVHDLAKKKN